MSQLSSFVHRFARSRVALVGSVVVLILVLTAVFAPWLSPHDPNAINPIRRLQPPSFEHWFGTDHLGRDVFSRVVHGARISMGVGAMVILVATTIGTAVGVLSGYYKAIDNVLMRLMDGLMAFPGILLAIALMASLGASQSNVVIALSIVYTPRVARIARAAVLVLREQVFVEAAIALGRQRINVLARHITPNCLGPINVQATFIFAYAILAEASLSFLGVGAPPHIPSWGNILNEGRAYLSLAPWMTLFPGTAIMISVLSLNLFGDGLRDLLDPRLRGAL